MSSFTTPARVELLDNFKFRLLEPFQFYAGNELNPDFVITVPAGFETDLTSSPRWLWPFVPPHGKSAKAAILHDYLLTQCTAEETGEGLSRYGADRIFLAGLIVLGYSELHALTLYRGVRLHSIKVNALKKCGLTK